MIYLASPWFKVHELKMCREVLKKMREAGFEVYAPFEHEIPNAWNISNEEWGRAVFEADVEALDKSDEVWVLNFGMYGDTGTAWECGYAYAKGKPIHQLLYGFGNPDYSLMMLNGCNTTDFMGNFLYNREDNFKINQK